MANATKKTIKIDEPTVEIKSVKVPQAAKEEGVGSLIKSTTGEALHSWLGELTGPGGRFQDNIFKLEAGDKTVIGDLNDVIMHAHIFAKALSSDIDQGMKTEISQTLDAMSKKYTDVCKAQGITFDMVDISSIDKISPHIRHMFNGAEDFVRFNMLQLELIRNALKEIGVDDHNALFNHMRDLKGHKRNGEGSGDAGTAINNQVPVDIPSSVPQAPVQDNTNASTG